MPETAAAALALDADPDPDTHHHEQIPYELPNQNARPVTHAHRYGSDPHNHYATNEPDAAGSPALPLWYADPPGERRYRTHIGHCSLQVWESDVTPGLWHWSGLDARGDAEGMATAAYGVTPARTDAASDAEVWANQRNDTDPEIQPAGILL